MKSFTNQQLFWSLLFLACTFGFVYSPHVWLNALCLAILFFLFLGLIIEWLLLSLPPKVMKQRTKYKLIKVDECESFIVPNETIAGKDIERLFAHPKMNAKTGGALRKLIHFWQAPAIECHQEIMEKGELYTKLSDVTTRILATPVEKIQQIAHQSAAEAMSQQKHIPEAMSVIRLNAFMTPITISFFYEFLFGKKCPSSVLPMFVNSIDDVLFATISIGRGNMEIRKKLLAYLRDLVEAEGGCPNIFGEDCTLTLDQRAKYLQGVWFHTGVAQVMRLSVNTIANLGGDPETMAKVKAMPVSDNPDLENALTETLRIFPGVTSTNRVATEDIELNENVRVPKNSSVIFDILSYHRSGEYAEADSFRAGRWENLKKREALYMPFGAGRRRCPAERLAFIAAKEFVLEIIQTLEFHIPYERGFLLKERKGSTGSTVTNDLCCVVRRQPVNMLKLRFLQYWLGWYLAVDSIHRGLTQLRIMPKNAKEAFNN